MPASRAEARSYGGKTWPSRDGDGTPTRRSLKGDVEVMIDGREEDRGAEQLRVSRGLTPHRSQIGRLSGSGGERPTLQLDSSLVPLVTVTVAAVFTLGVYA